MTQGAQAPTGQVIDSPAPVAELLRRVQAMPLPPPRRPGGRARPAATCPAGSRNTTHGEGVRARRRLRGRPTRTSGFSEGFDDYSTARVRLEVAGRGPRPVDRAHRVGRGRPGPGHRRAADRAHRAGRATQRHRGAQGHPGRQRRLVLGVPADLRHRRRGQGRLRAGPRARAGASSQRRLGRTEPGLRLDGGKVVSAAGESLGELAGLLGDEVIEETVRVAAPADRARSTRRPGRASRTCSTRSPRTARWWTSTPSSAWSRWSRWTAPRTSARRSTRRRCEGQIQGGSAQGLGLARDGGDPGRRRQDQEPVVHRLPDPDDPRHAADADRRSWSTPTRTRRTGCAGSASRRRSPPARPSWPRSAPPPGCR